MFKKSVSTILLAAAACSALFAGAILSACSSDSNSAGPVGVPQESSSSSFAENLESSSSAVIPGTSSAVIPGTDPGSPLSSSNVIPGSTGDLASSSSSIAAPDDTPADPALSDTPADPTVFWSDEFQGDALDITKWTYEIGTGENGWGNGEWQYYTDRTDNAYVADGVLHIAAKKESYEGANYTSARIITKGKFEFTYGTIEARIALPSGKGIWPAFWMLGANIDNAVWPTCGEIDIIEAVNDESVVYGTHHWDHEGQHAQYGNSTKEYYGTSYPMDIREFHNYKMTWDKNAITMYVDDFKYQEIDITLEKDAAGNNIASDMETFHKDFFFILNVAVGGTWPGFEIDDSQFPNEMLVDYIRVYK